MTEKRSRVSWKLECVDKTFLEACIEQITITGREGCSLKSSSWKVVAEKLMKEHSFDVDRKQMKNRYDYLKSKYVAWLKLNDRTGNVYNPSTNTFTLTEEEWEAESKANKFVEKLRRAPLPCPDLCTKLFEGATSTGFESWGPSSTQPRPDSEISKKDFENVETDPGTQMENQTSKQPVCVSKECSSKSKKGKKRKDKDDGDGKEKTMDSKLLEVGEDISKIAKMLIEKNTIDNDMDACIEKLEKMEWGDDERYNTALLLFAESADVRNMWLRLKPASCEAWVKSLGRKHGYDI